jgi:hypothetical protein
VSFPSTLSLLLFSLSTLNWFHVPPVLISLKLSTFSTSYFLVLLDSTQAHLCCSLEQCYTLPVSWIATLAVPVPSAPTHTQLGLNFPIGSLKALSHTLNLHFPCMFPRWPFICPEGLSIMLFQNGSY